LKLPKSIKTQQRIIVFITRNLGKVYEKVGDSILTEINIPDLAG